VIPFLCLPCIALSQVPLLFLYIFFAVPHTAFALRKKA
jgi:hypothetical protein